MFCKPAVPRCRVRCAFQRQTTTRTKCQNHLSSARKQPQAAAGQYLAVTGGGGARFRGQTNSQSAEITRRFLAKAQQGQAGGGPPPARGGHAARGRAARPQKSDEKAQWNGKIGPVAPSKVPWTTLVFFWKVAKTTTFSGPECPEHGILTAGCATGPPYLCQIEPILTSECTKKHEKVSWTTFVSGPKSRKNHDF